MVDGWKETKGTIEFIRDPENGTTSIVVDSVELGSWLNRQEPGWAKKVRELIEQRAVIAGNASPVSN